MSSMRQSLILLANLCLCFGIGAGPGFSIGLFFIYFQTDFDASVGQVSLVMALPSACFYLGGPLYAATYRKLGIFKTLSLSSTIVCVSYMGTSLVRSYVALLIFQGMLFGIGGGFLHMVAYTVTGTAFKETRAMANNILYSSVLAAAMMATPAIQALINTYSWRGVFFIEAACVLNVIPLSYIVSKCFDLVMMKSERTKRSVQMAQMTEYNRKVAKDPLFYVFCVSSVGIYTVQTVTLPYFVRYAQSIGVEDGLAVTQLTMFLFLCLTLSIVTGVISSIEFKSPRLQQVTMEKYLSFLCFMQACVMLIPVLLPTETAYFVYMVSIGIAYGGIAAFPLTLIPKYFDVKQLPVAFGLRSFIAGLFSLTVPPFTGFLIDLCGTFKVVQFVSAIMVSIGGILLIFVSKRIEIRNKKMKNSTELAAITA